jgi:OmpA-OmpF porin, OOP family
MKRVLTVIASVCIAGGAMAAAAPAVNMGSWYLNGNVGASFPTKMKAYTKNDANWIKGSYNTGYNLNLEGGYQFGNNISLEAQVGYIRNTISKFNKASNGTNLGSTGNTAAMVYMVNSLYHFYNASSFAPYIGLGLGAVSVSPNWKPKNSTITRLSGTDTLFAYQALAGISYVINNHWAVDLGYRFLGSNQGSYNMRVSTVKSTAKGYYRTSLVNLGATYYFS